MVQLIINYSTLESRVQARSQLVAKYRKEIALAARAVYFGTCIAYKDRASPRGQIRNREKSHGDQEISEASEKGHEARSNQAVGSRT
jgi:hypothetical protein